MSNIAPIKKFNPHELSEEVVLALATGREKLLETMIAEMSRCLKSGMGQHFILFGPRGIGKSFFTRLLKITHDRSDEFRNSRFLLFPEEQDNLVFIADLLDMISTKLEGEAYHTLRPRWETNDFQWQESKKRLRKALDTIKQEQGIQHVFFTLENLQDFIPKLSDIENGRLREFLSDFEEMSLIGSSLRPDLDQNYNKKVFQVFKKLDIAPWTEKEFLEFYEKRALLNGPSEEIKQRLKLSRNKVKAIAHFTGGSPRLAVILSSLVLEQNVLNTIELLDGIIDDLTTYYQNLTKDIPDRSRSLFDLLIRIGENINQSDLAASFNPPIEQKTMARSFNWLLDNYYVVSKKQGKGNNKLYYVRDRLYVLYYQRRQIFADQIHSFIGVFVDFLTEYFNQQEWREQIVKLDSNNSYSLPLLLCYSEKKGISLDKNMSFKELQSLLIDKANSPEKTFQAAVLYQKEQYAEVIDFVSADPNPSIDSIFYLGSAYYKIGELAKAIEQNQRVISINPTYPAPYYNIGVIHMNLGEYEEGVVFFKKSIELNPDYLEAYINLGNCYYLLKEFDFASKNFLEVIKRDSNHVLGLYNIAGIYFLREEYIEAENYYRKVLEVNPNYASALNNLGVIYQKREQLLEAQAYYEKALKSDPSFLISYSNLGWLYLKKGDLREAEDYIRKAIYPRQTEPLIWSNLIGIYLIRKDFNQIEIEAKGIPKFISFPHILGNALSELIREFKIDPFEYLMLTVEWIKGTNGSWFVPFINTLSVSLFVKGKEEVIETFVDELDSLNNFPQIKMMRQLWSYLLHPENHDIASLHPEVREVVETVLSSK